MSNLISTSIVDIEIKCGPPCFASDDRHAETIVMLSVLSVDGDGWLSIVEWWQVTSRLYSIIEIEAGPEDLLYDSGSVKMVADYHERIELASIPMLHFQL
jgi:hypothetical protein